MSVNNSSFAPAMSAAAEQYIFGRKMCSRLPKVSHRYKESAEVTRMLLDKAEYIQNLERVAKEVSI